MIKKYKELFILGFVIVAIVFYWYGYRPSEIKKDCYKVAVNNALQESINRGRDDGTFLPKVQNMYYKWCLEKEGL